MTRNGFGSVMLHGFGAAALAGLAACAGGGQFAKEMATSLGEGALVGFSNHVQYETEDSWGQAYEPSGRGVEGVGTRSGDTSSADCSAVTDEFEQLYDSSLTQNPSAQTHDGAVTEAEYEKLLADGKFRLSDRRRGGVIALLKTDAGNHAKFVVHWNAAGLSMTDLVVYDAKGQPIHQVVGPMQLPLRFAADIDPIEAGSAGGDTGGFDLLFGPDGSGVLTFAAPKGAGISFPTRSLCP